MQVNQSITSRPLLIIAALVALGIPVAILWILSFSGGFSEILNWIYDQQREWQKSISASLTGLTGDNPAAAAWALVVGSFLYGFFHAAGPGHGKVIMTTYLLSNREETRRALLLTVMAALLQAVVAVAIIYGLVVIVGIATKDSTQAAKWSERLSYILVSIMGLWLIWRVLKPIFAKHLQNASQTGHVHTHDHHHHAHGHHAHHHHDHLHHTDDHDHGPECGCGHQHGPTPEQIAASKDWKISAGIVLSIGLRPCTGAILVLVLAKSLGLLWAGVVGAFVMAAGVALAISCLAFMAVRARGFADTVFNESSTVKLQGITRVVSFAGGAFLCFLGASLFAASFAARSPFGI
jgi:ABC-type nickel/cobalt efflux system permease component RcnA